MSVIVKHKGSPRRFCQTLSFVTVFMITTGQVGCDAKFDFQ